MRNSKLGYIFHYVNYIFYHGLHIHFSLRKKKKIKSELQKNINSSYCTVQCTQTVNPLAFRGCVRASH